MCRPSHPTGFLMLIFYLLKSTNYEAPHPVFPGLDNVTSFILDPNILLSTLLSNILSLYSYLRDQVSHQYKTEDKIVDL
jgi:hypothetical protein